MSRDNIVFSDPFTGCRYEYEFSFFCCSIKKYDKDGVLVEIEIKPYIDGETMTTYKCGR